MGNYIWYEVKATYEKFAKTTGKKKIINEVYLVNDRFITEAIERFKQESPLQNELGFEVTACKALPEVMVCGCHEGEVGENDEYYNAKIEIITEDENTGAYKTKTKQLILAATSLKNAMSKLADWMVGTISEWHPKSITKQNIDGIYY